MGVLLPIGILCVGVLHAVSFRYSRYFLPEEHSWFIPGGRFLKGVLLPIGVLCVGVLLPIAVLCVGVLLPIGVLCVGVLHAVSFRYSRYFLPKEHSWFISGDAF